MRDDLTDDQVEALRKEERLARWERDRDRLPASCRAKHPPKADPELRRWMEDLVTKLMRPK
jgi:hypothetical protein